MLGNNDTDRTGGAPNILKLNEQNIQLMEGPVVIHPFSTFRSIWIVLTFLVLLAWVYMRNFCYYLLILYLVLRNLVCLFPIIAFPKFDKNYLAINPLASQPWFGFYFKVITDVWFLIDLVFNFRTGWVTSEGNIILHLTHIRKQYLKFWFWIDLLAIIPFDIVLEIFFSSEKDSRRGF